MSFGQYSNDQAERPNPLANKATTGRVKHVFADNDKIAHLWFHQAQDSARNPQGNFYFDGDTIYSYGSHFPLARIVEHNGQRAILETIKDYSVTTQRHKSVVRSAIRTWDGNNWVPASGVTIFGVECPGKEPRELVSEWRERIKLAQERVTTTKRIQLKTRVKLFDTASRLVNDANRFAEFFDLPERFEMPASIEALRSALEAERIRQAEETERRNVAEASRRETEYRIMRDCVPDWVRGGPRLWIEDEESYDIRYLPEAYLRVDPKDPTIVETSKGADVPLEHVLRVLPIVKRLYATGETYKRNGHTIHLGHYALDAIDAEGNVTAGCHYFTRAEVDRFIISLGGQYA